MSTYSPNTKDPIDEETSKERENHIRPRVEGVLQHERGVVDVEVVDHVPLQSCRVVIDKVTSYMK